MAVPHSSTTSRSPVAEPTVCQQLRLHALALGGHPKLPPGGRHGGILHGSEPAAAEAHRSVIPEGAQNRSALCCLPSTKDTNKHPQKTHPHGRCTACVVTGSNLGSSESRRTCPTWRCLLGPSACRIDAHASRDQLNPCAQPQVVHPSSSFFVCCTPCGLGCVI